MRLLTRYKESVGPYIVANNHRTFARIFGDPANSRRTPDPYVLQDYYVPYWKYGFIPPNNIVCCLIQIYDYDHWLMSMRCVNDKHRVFMITPRGLKIVD